MLLSLFVDFVSQCLIYPPTPTFGRFLLEIFFKFLHVPLPYADMYTLYSVGDFEQQRITYRPINVLIN